MGRIIIDAEPHLHLIVQMVIVVADRSNRYCLSQMPHQK